MLRSVEKLSMKKLSPTQLSDDELYIKLQKYGINTGPVTQTTKTILERKLNSIQCQTELRIDQTSGSIVDFNNTNNKSDMNQTECINGSPVAIHGQNSVSCTENNKNDDSSLYYGVAFLSGTMMSGKELNCYGEVPPFVFTDKKDALKIIKKYKGSRFKAFSNKEEAINFASRPCDEITSSPLLVPSQCPVLDRQIAYGLIEKPSLFKAPKIQEMAKLRKAIESGDAEYFKKTVWSNPRYLVSNGDTPTIFKEGFRYNAMHIAAMKKQAAICHIILNTIEDSEFMHLLYPDDTETIRDQRISFILDLYLNMPEKPLCETPLHFASKFGCLKTVEVLLAHPLCDKHRENVDKKTAKEIICDRDPLASSEYKKQIESLFEERYYVPVLRSDDNSLQPIIGEPLSPDVSQCNLKNRDLKRVYTPSMSVKAIAGPMSPKQAKIFYKKWKTPPRSNAKNLYKIRLGDAEKGLEVVGRELARESRVSWKEFWPFLACWCDLSSPEGLLKLENHLKTKHANMDSQEAYIQQKNSELSCTNEKFSGANLNRSNFQDSPHKPEDLKCPVSGCNSPLSHLCHLLEKVSLNRNSQEIIINRTVSCENTSKKTEGKNHLSEVSRVLNFEDCCEKKNSLFQASHITTETYIKNKGLETNCNLEMENKWTLNSNMGTYASTALSLLIQNISTSLIDIVLQENSPQKCVVSNDLLDSALPHLEYFYQTVQNDDTNSNSNSIHCDISKQIATNLQHNLILQEVEQIHRYLKSYLSIACDLSSSDDEYLDCLRDWNYKKLRGRTIYKQHLRCIFQFLCSYISDSGTFEEWEEMQVCCCEWKLKTNSNNSLNTDFNFHALEDKLVNNNEPKDHISVSQLKENDLMDDSSDEEFYTPPSSLPSRNSPKGTGTPELIAFIQGRYPSKADVDAVRALGDTKIDPILYPHIFQWRNIINSFPSDVVESFCSPAHKRKVLNQDSFSYNSNYSISPIARSTGRAKALACMPKNLYETLLSWEESSSE